MKLKVRENSSTKVSTRQLHSVIWNRGIPKETIAGSVTTYGAEVWKITEQTKQKLKTTEMNF